jgi:hypothetical protein
MKRTILLFAVVISSFALRADSLRDVIGVAHVAGRYSTSNDDEGRDFLSEGARRIRFELGSRVIKLWLTNEPASDYPFHSPLWQSIQHANSVTEVIAHPYYRRVLSMPFSTIILMIPNSVWFHDGLSAQEEFLEERLFYELTWHLMTTYRETGKTFVLQNWEGDWLLRMDNQGRPLPDAADPSPLAVAGMIRWIAARQRGVEGARAYLAQYYTGVTVKNAVEVNHLRRAKDDPSRITVANHVLPFVRADLYSYSAWESGDPTGQMLTEMLTFLDERASGENNIYVGEYGLPENDFGTAEHLHSVVAMTEAALEWGALYLVYWQIYCNTFAGQDPHGPPLNSDMRGFWLIRPDGTRSPVWDYFRSRMGVPGRDWRVRAERSRYPGDPIAVRSARHGTGQTAHSHR